MSDGAILHGQQYDPKLGVVRFTEQVKDYTGPDTARVTGDEGTTGKEIQPIDRGAAKVRTVDLASVATMLASLARKSPTTIDRKNVPPVLTGVTITYNTSLGFGTDNHPTSQMGLYVYGSGSAQVSPNASTQGSSSIIPDIQPELKETWAEDVPAFECEVWLADNSTRAQVIAAVATLMGASVSDWPIMKPVAHTITLKGQQVSVAAKADSRVSGGGDTTNGHLAWEWGNGSSKETGVTIKTLRIPPSIHGILTFSGQASSSAGITVTADASIPQFLTNVPAIANTKSATGTAVASVEPSVLAATSPSAIPTSGYYIHKIVPGPNLYDHTLYNVIVFDAAYFA